MKQFNAIEPQGPRRLGKVDHMIGMLLGFGYLVALLKTSNGICMSRDESFYVHAADRYLDWFKLLALDPIGALGQEAMDAAWKVNHEHPAVAKALTALSVGFQEATGVFSTASDAYRFPGMISGALLVWLIFIFGTQAASRTLGLTAALIFALIPRVFFHAHLNAFDIPITLSITWVIYAYWRALYASRWSWFAGIAFGVSLCVKHNTWIVPWMLIIHWLLHRAQTTTIKRSPTWLWAFGVVGIPLFVLLWPWLWHDTLYRMGAYVARHVMHEYYETAYFDRSYFKPPFPMSFPWVMTWLTLPITCTTLAILGVLRALAALFDQRRKDRIAFLFRYKTYSALSRWVQNSFTSSLPISTLLLWLAALSTPIVTISWPSTPIFGGTKHWFTAYPFLALLAAHGFCWVSAQTATWIPLTERAKQKHIGQPAVASALCLALVVTPLVLETAHARTYGLAYFSSATGGVRGAASLGMKRQYWGFSTHGAVDFLKKELPQGGTVWLGDTTRAAWKMLIRDGVAPKNIRPESRMAKADYILVQLEHHFAELEYQAWVITGSTRPAHVVTYDGVPLISIYRNKR